MEEGGALRSINVNFLYSLQIDAWNICFKTVAIRHDCIAQDQAQSCRLPSDYVLMCILLRFILHTLCFTWKLFTRYSGSTMFSVRAWDLYREGFEIGPFELASLYSAFGEQVVYLSAPVLSLSHICVISILSTSFVQTHYSVNNSQSRSTHITTGWGWSHDLGWSNTVNANAGMRWHVSLLLSWSGWSLIFFESLNRAHLPFQLFTSDWFDSSIWPEYLLQQRRSSACNAGFIVLLASRSVLCLWQLISSLTPGSFYSSLVSPSAWFATLPVHWLLQNSADWGEVLDSGVSSHRMAKQHFSPISIVPQNHEWLPVLIDLCQQQPSSRDWLSAL